MPIRPSVRPSIVKSSMFHGRESLIRLIGKRKRNLSSNLSHFLLHSNFKEEEVAASASNSSIVKQEEEEEEIEDGNDSEWVTCPVCGASVKGSDQIINSHLDICLTRGQKRKLTQRTLLQLNFSPQSRNKTASLILDKSKESLRKCELADGNESSDSRVTVESGSFNKDEQKHTSNSLKCIDVQKESTNVERNSTSEVVHANLVAEVETFIVDRKFHDNVELQAGAKLSLLRYPQNANFVAEVETFIVGRKFHDNVELQEGAKLSLLRDPQNAKDKHAIKVLFADSISGCMLGYVPRELAQFLSPLIDNHHLKCEVYVISPAHHPLDVVLIRLACHKSVTSENDDHENFEFLWENVRNVTENAKTNPPSMTKYQQNFRLIIKDVIINHAHLLSSNEKLLLGSFDSLSNDAQRLFIRIYTRKGPWFRLSNISYPEVVNLPQAIGELQLASYISSVKSTEDITKHNNMKEILELLTVLEMRDILSVELSKRKINCARRQDLVDYLFAAYEDGSCQVLPQMVLERLGRCIKISSDADTLLWRVQRLFFLNGEQDLSAFLLSDLGLIKFPDYNCIITNPVFSCRSDFLEYEEAVEVAQIMDESLDENNIELVMRCIDASNNNMQTCSKKATLSLGSDSPPTFFSRFSDSYVYSKVLSLGVSVFERERRYEDAINLLKGLLCKITHDSRRGYWTLRLSVDLEHIGRINESLSVAEKGMEDSWIRAGSRMALQKRVLRLGKPPRRWKTPSYANSFKRSIKEVSIKGRSLTSEIGSKNIYYGYDDELCGVEQLALQYYAEEGGGWKGVHSESGIWMTIFGILMWDVIFSDVPEVFRSRFQIAPLDLHTDDFYITRKDLIESQLLKIQEGMAEEILIISWELHVNTACQGVNWDKHSLSDLRAIVSCIRGSCMASLLRHIALDYRSWSSGMPDLLLWCFDAEIKNYGQAKLVEVKSLNDQLSEQQRAWLLILMDCGFDVEVCKVSPTAKC